jgi:mannose-6-phosphate isomerase-like protein (cupin superfamily)
MAVTNIVTEGVGEIIRLGPIVMRVLEDGSRTDNRFGAFEITVPPRIAGPPRHAHHMHDETFLILSGALRFTVGDEARDPRAGDYVVVPIDAPHTFANPFDEPAVFFNSFTPAYYVNYFRELQRLAAGGPPSPPQIAEVMARYATTPC